MFKKTVIFLSFVSFRFCFDSKANLKLSLDYESLEVK